MIICYAIFRYASRSLVIPFSLPTIGPVNQEETRQFQELADSLKDASSAVGWAIGVGRWLKRGDQFNDGLLETVNQKLAGVDSRLCTSYCTLLYCIKKVSWLVF